MSVPGRTTLLLVCSNVFMPFAWYAHLLFGYLLQVPAALCPLGAVYRICRAPA